MAAAADMSGKVVVVTGANTGIGKQTALELAEAGATVVLACRDTTKGEAAAGEIRVETGNERVAAMELDLASFGSIRRFASDFLERYDRLDVLVNNAGLVLTDRTETEEGFETTFGVNHLGHFLLTDLLLDRLQASAPSRIVNVASGAHKNARRGLDFDDLQSERRYSGFAVYSKSKLANVLYTRELARRLDGTGVTVNALHPGFVASEFAQGGDTNPLYALGTRLARPFAISVERGARTSVYLASSPEVAGVSGSYFFKCRPASVSAAARDDDEARRLWEESERLVAAAST